MRIIARARIGKIRCAVRPVVQTSGIWCGAPDERRFHIRLVPGVGVEPTVPMGREADFKSAAFAVFATPAPQVVRRRKTETQNAGVPRCSELVSLRLEATVGLEPTMGVLQTPALTSWPRRLFWSGRRDSNPRPPPWQGGALPLSHFRFCPSWCRGGDLNPYALSGTAPSRRRVYLFHHLGSPRSILHILPLLTRSGLPGGGGRLKAA